MALMLGKLYDALMGAGATPEQAREAAEEVARYDDRLNRIERDLTLLKWMVGLMIAMQVGIVWMQWQIVRQLAGLEARVTAIESRLGAIEGRLPTAGMRAGGVYSPLDP